MQFLEPFLQKQENHIPRFRASQTSKTHDTQRTWMAIVNV